MLDPLALGSEPSVSVESIRRVVNRLMSWAQVQRQMEAVVIEIVFVRSLGTVQGERSPQVARDLAVDFSTAGPAPGGGRIGARSRSAAPFPDITIRALVKWFVPAKGYGVLQTEDGSADVFRQAAVVEAAGHTTLPGVRRSPVRWCRGTRVRRRRAS